MKDIRGITLVEVMIASALTSILLLAVTWQQRQMVGFQKAVNDTGNIETQNVLTERLMRQFFRRGYSIGFVPVATTKYPTLGRGFSIFGNGTIVVAADMRDCDSFDPSNPYVAPTHITFTCCDQNLVVENVPASRSRADTATFTDTSACKKTPGLSITVREGAAMRVKRSECIRGYQQMTVMPVGLDSNRSSTLYGINLQSEFGTVIGMNGAIMPGSERRLEFYDSIGNQGGALMTYCEDVIPYHP